MKIIVSFFFFFLFWLSVPAQSSMEYPTAFMLSNIDTMKIEYHPIGIFHTSLTPETGAPRQGILQPENKAVIEIFDEYAEALRNLGEFEYIIVLYHLDKSEGWYTTVTPPGSRRSFGMFATRTHHRPNPIGLGVIRLEKVEGSRLHVSGVDAFEGTPVLDIKPWLPSIDCPAVRTGQEMERQLGID